MRGQERIPLHDHSDRNSGGRIAPSTVVQAVGGSSTGTTTTVDTSGFLTTTRFEGHVPYDHGSMGATETIDPVNGNIHIGTLTADCTITLANPAASVGAIGECRFTQDGTGGWVVTWPGSVTFLGASSPASTAAGTTTIYILESLDGGSSWVAVIVGSGGTAASTVTDETTFGISPAVGTDTEYARQDHTHGSPANPVTLTAIAALGFLTGPTFTVIGQEQRISDGSTTTWTLDNDFEENSVSARNLTTGHGLSVTETLPNSVLISAAGTAGDVIAFAYAASVV